MDYARVTLAMKQKSTMIIMGTVYMILVRISQISMKMEYGMRMDPMWERMMVCAI